MKHLGETGTEQFQIETRVDGQVIQSQPIHDPFICNTTVLQPTRWSLLKGLFRPPEIRIQVRVWGTDGAQRAIMTLNPERLAEETQEILKDRAIARERSKNDACVFGLK